MSFRTYPTQCTVYRKMYKQHLYNNILFKITFLMRKGNYPLFHIVTLKIHAFATVVYQWMYANSTGFLTLRMKSLWVSSLQLRISLASVKSGPHCGCSVWGLDIDWLSSLRPSAGASWMAQMSNWCGSASKCLTVIPFAKPRILC
jgi:hypothetical protein